MLCDSDMRALRDSLQSAPSIALDDSAIAYAAARVSSPDRNVRVLMLRVLRHGHGERAMRGVLAGLHDEARRVRTVAIQACPHFLDQAEIAARLLEIARDHNMKRKLRRRALSMLAGDEGRMTGDLSPAAAAALDDLLGETGYHFSIAFALARLERRPRILRLLERLAPSPDEAAAKMARRALRGERIAHIDAYANDASERRRIVAECEIAHGRMYYWLPAGFPVKTLPG